MKSRGFTLAEVVIALFFLAMSIASIMVLNQTSNQTTMDAYYEFLALQLAKEPIEVFRGFGYRWLKTVNDHPIKEYPVNQMHDIAASGNRKDYPNEAFAFKRYIGVTSESVAGPNGVSIPAFRVSVQVSPSSESWVKSWLTRKSDIVLEALILEPPL